MPDQAQRDTVTNTGEGRGPSRRAVVQATAWAVPVISTMAATPALAASHTVRISGVPAAVAVGTRIELAEVNVTGTYTGDLTFTLPTGFEWADGSPVGTARVISSAGVEGMVVVPAFIAVSQQTTATLTAQTSAASDSLAVQIVKTYELVPLGWVNYTEYYNSEIRLDFYVDVPDNITIDTMHYNYYSYSSTVATPLYRAGEDAASTVQNSVVERFGVVAVTRGGAVPANMKRLWVHVRGDSHHEDANEAMKWMLRVTFTDGTRAGDTVPVSGPGSTYPPVEVYPDLEETPGATWPSAPPAPTSDGAVPTAAQSSTLEVELTNIPYLPRGLRGRGVGINAWDATAGSGRFPVGGPQNSQSGWGILRAPGSPIPLDHFYVDATSGGGRVSENARFVHQLYYQFVGPGGTKIPAQPVGIQLGFSRFYGSSQTPDSTTGAYLNDTTRVLEGEAPVTAQLTEGYWKLLVWPQHSATGDIGTGVITSEVTEVEGVRGGSWDPATEPGHQIGSIFVVPQP